MPLLAVAATTMDTDRMILQDGSPGSGSGQSQQVKHIFFKKNLYFTQKFSTAFLKNRYEDFNFQKEI